jgi:hypothetical protein
MTHDAFKELISALAREAAAQGTRVVVDFPNGDRKLLEPEGLEVSDDVLLATDHRNRNIEIPYQHIADISIAPDEEAVEELDEIVSVREIPNGVHFTFRSGASRGLLGVSLAEAQREVGCIGDKVAKRRFVRVPGPTPEPPIAIADLKKPRKS